MAERTAADDPRSREAAARALARASAAVTRTALRPNVQFIAVLLLALLAARSCTSHTAGLHADVAVGLALAATLPLTALRVAPLFALGTTVAANSVFVVIARLAWPATAIAAWLIALALGALLLRRWQGVAILAAAQAAVIAAVFVPDRINATPWDATIAESVAALTAWWIGESVRARREVRLRLAGTAQRLRVLAEQDAVARERARIARELHDVVAHHVSTIAVRAATLPYEVEDLPPPVRAALAEIAGGARAALVDLRAVLGVLRRGDEDAEGMPQPRLADATALVERVQATGTAVELRVVGVQRQLPDGVEVCGYRIIQEALTNAIRHAPGSKSEVEVAYGVGEVTVRVRDSGSCRPADTADGPGYGLIGMRERVTMLGGSLHAGPRHDGGFEVIAKLPWLRPTPSDAAAPRREKAAP